MIITISGGQGSGKTAVTEHLRDYFTYRGMACYVYDFLRPLREMCDALYIVGDQYGLVRPFNNPDLVDAGMQGCLYSMDSAFLGRAAVNEIMEATARWNELKMLYVAIVDGPVSSSDLNLFDSYRVCLNCNKEIRQNRIVARSDESVILSEDHPLEAGFNDCAVSNIFDLVVDTNEPSPKETADLIGNKFLDKLNDFIKRDKTAKSLEYQTL